MAERKTTRKSAGEAAKTTRSAKAAEMNAQTEIVTAAQEIHTENAAEKIEQPAAQPIQMVVEQRAPTVKILYIDSVIPNNQIPIGPGRYITGSGRIFGVRLDQFEGEFMTPMTMKLIDNRKFIVLDGLTDEQRLQYNCYYQEGEVLKNDGMFDAIFDMTDQQAVAVFSALCPEHKRLVATRFASAYFEGADKRRKITRSMAEALNKASRDVDPDGLFTPIVRDLNEQAG